MWYNRITNISFFQNTIMRMKMKVTRNSTKKIFTLQCNIYIYIYNWFLGDKCQNEDFLMASKDIKMSSISLVIKEMQTEKKMQYHCVYWEWLRLNRLRLINVGEDVDVSYITVGIINWYDIFRKQCGLHRKLKKCSQ